MDHVAQRDLKILTAIEAGRDVTQRGLAKSLDIALGLANLYLKRLAHKGYIKITTIPPNRIRYLLTPRGFAEKTRLTYEYMSLSLKLYQEMRAALRDALLPLVGDGARRIALYGTGEAVELAYLTLLEVGLEPLAVYADTDRETFLGVPVRPTEALADAPIDRLIVALFDPATGDVLEKLGRLVPSDKLIVLGRAPGGASAAASGR